MKYINHERPKRKIFRNRLEKVLLIGGTALAFVGGIIYPSYVHKKTEEFREQRFANYDVHEPKGKLDIDEYVYLGGGLEEDFKKMDKDSDGYVTPKEYKFKDVFE